jgi:hypothetical protein
MSELARSRPSTRGGPRAFAACAFGVAILAAANGSYAAPCAGFTDVEETHPFCPSVEWLRNRAITLGCTSTSVFCPTAAVTRLSMAAFMNRLGVALTPQIVYQEQAGTSIDLDTPPSTELCLTVTNVFDAGTFPRRAGLSAVVTAKVDNSPANVDVSLVQRVNGGPWTPVTAHPSSAGAGATQWLHAVAHNVDVPLAAGNTYAFGVAVSRSSSPPSSGDLLEWNCQVEVVVYSRTGGASPF